MAHLELAKVGSISLQAGWWTGLGVGWGLSGTRVSGLWNLRLG